jgi:hypothetical protein
MDLEVKFLSIENIEKPVKIVAIGLVCMFGVFFKAYSRMIKQAK